MRHDVSLAAIEDFIKAKHKELTFPAWLEERYEADVKQRRSQRLHAAIVPNVIVYNLFLIADWFVIPDQFWLAAALHFGMVTPWLLLIRRCFNERQSKRKREGAAASIPLMIVLQILCTFTLTRSPDADHYQYFVLLVLLFTNTIQRLPYRYAVTVSGIIVVLHAVAVGFSSQMSTAVAAIAVLVQAVAVYLTLTGNYYLERDARRAYLQRLRDRLHHVQTETVAMRDALTELGNRHVMKSKIAEIWRMRGVSGEQAAAIMLDIDHFKQFNDRYGHVAGDLCLKRVAACVVAELRSERDAAIRYGGEEILVLLPEAETMTAARIAERIRRAVEALAIPHEAGMRRIVTASLGVAAGPVATIAAAELIAAADAALYAAKHNGRNQVWPALLGDSDMAGGAQIATMRIAQR